MDDASAFESLTQALVPTNHEVDLTWVLTLTLTHPGPSLDVPHWGLANVTQNPSAMFQPDISGAINAFASHNDARKDLV